MKSFVEEPLPLCEVNAHWHEVLNEEDGDSLTDYHVDVLVFNSWLLENLICNVSYCTQANQRDHYKTELNVDVPANNNQCADACTQKYQGNNTSGE